MKRCAVKKLKRKGGRDGGVVYSSHSAENALNKSKKGKKTHVDGGKITSHVVDPIGTETVILGKKSPTRLTHWGTKSDGKKQGVGVTEGRPTRGKEEKDERGKRSKH